MKNSVHISQSKLTEEIMEAIKNLESKEYTIKFRRETTCLYCFELDELVTPESFFVDRCYSFQGQSNPDTDRILYAISFSHGRKGFLIDACNVYSDNISPEMMEKLK